MTDHLQGVARGTQALAAVASPCIDVCTMDATSGLCAGCLRTLDEIAAWSQLDEAGKRAVWNALAMRRVDWQLRLQTEGKVVDA